MRHLKATYGGIACAGMIYCFAIATCAAQVAAPSAAQTTAPAPVPSLKHTLVKTATQKLMSLFVTGVFVYGGTGSVVAASALTAITTTGAVAIFATNDYLWDYFDPPANTRANEPTFSVASSAWRNTKKYLTYKPAIMAFATGTAYLYTGVLSTAVGFGVGSAFIYTGVFYANNMAWDWYDWYSSPGKSAAAADRSKYAVTP